MYDILNKQLKFLMTSIITLSILFSSCVMVNADETNYAEDDHQTIVISEEETNYYESLLSEKDILISKVGFSKQNDQLNAVNVKIEEYKQFVDELSKSSLEELKAYGYTENQIRSIKKANKTEADYRSASFSVTTSGSITSTYSSSSNRTSYTVYAYFTVSAYTGPLYNKNNFGIASVPSINQPMQTSGSGSITYRYYNGNTPNFTTRAASKQHFNGASKYSFPVGIDVNNTRGYVYKGSFTSSSVVQGRADMVDARIAYGYAASTTSYEYGISVGVELGVISTTISVTSGVSGGWKILGSKVISGTTK